MKLEEKKKFSNINLNCVNHCTQDIKNDLILMQVWPFI